MIGTLCFEGGARPFIHNLSKPYHGYTHEETELKIKYAQDNKSGPLLCETIQEKTGFKCPPDGCGVKSPVHLLHKKDWRTFEFGEFISEDGNKFDNFENSQGVETSSNLEWPVLEEKALSGIAGDFVELAVRNSEADPAAVLMTFLCRFGIEVGPEPFLMVGDTSHHARVFGVIVGSSSKARKGTSGKPVKRLFEFEKFAKGDDENTLAYIPARFSPGPLSSGEGLIYAVRDKTETWKVDKRTGQGEWVIEDPGIEDKRLFILDEEFASALSCTKREGIYLHSIGDAEPYFRHPFLLIFQYFIFLSTV